MDFDFAIILVVVTLVTGGIWLGYSLYTMMTRTATDQSSHAGDQAVAAGAGATSAPDVASKGDKDDLPVIVEYAKSFFPVFLLVLVVRSFLVEPFQIPSQSMLPTLEVGDFILVNKYNYGLRVPVLGYKFLEVGEPERGDVMVFKNPEDDMTNYIKRVIGVPGDKITYRNKKLLVNGELVDERLIAALPAHAPRELIFEEKLGEGKHRIIEVNRPNPHGEGEWVVPEGHYFMMGDNRDRSKDSRFIGFVPDENIVGEAFAIWMHWESMFSSLPSFSRVGTIE